MTHDPRTTDEIYESLRDSLTGKITKLTNFTNRSFNNLWGEAFSEQIRRLEVLSFVAELAGWIDYAGGPITESDLEELGVADDISAEEVNEFMEDEYLDQQVEILGISRNSGQRSSGTVEFTTQIEPTDIDSGTRVTTTPDSSGNTLDFLTTESVESANGETVVTDVSIQAVEPGAEYDVPAGEITRIANPTVGVKSVTNPESTTGGLDEESNEELRARAKQVVQSSSEGGTTDGIRGYIRQTVEGVTQGDVVIDESTDTTPPYVDVIVDGGIDAEVIDAIEFSRPTGIRHNLIRPEVIQLGYQVDLLGTDISTSNVDDQLTDFLLESGIGENIYSDEVINIIMNADSDIINIDNIGGVIERVTNETFEYENGVSDYRLDYTYESTNGSITVIDDSGTVYSEGSGQDFVIEDQTGDGWGETLVWVGGTPDDGEKFYVDYDVTVFGQTSPEDWYRTNLVRDEVFTWDANREDSFTYDTSVDLYEMSAAPFDGTTSITDGENNTYTEGTDYEIIDDTGNGFAQTIDWSIGGSTPNNNITFTVTYTQKVYETEYEVVETPSGEINDESGNTYEQDVDYDIVDVTEDTENESISWLSEPSGLADGDEFYLTYLNEGDVAMDNREKADPGTITVSDT